jgi:hypothetical protein
MKAARVSLLALGALVLAACSSTPSAQTTSTTNPETGLPGMYPNFSYPVADPALPQSCSTSPNQHYSSEVGPSGAERQEGGAIEVTALVIPRGTFTFATAELTAIVHDAGNCFYSANVIQKGDRSEMVFGFNGGAGPMDPSAVAHFLRLQRFAFSTVTGP